MLRYTFNPPEEELINYYLNDKITEKDDPEGKQISEVSICHYEPTDLPGLAKIESSHIWYFISPVEKFGRLNRTKRASKSGHWKITGNRRSVKDVDGNPIGSMKVLVFQENKRSSTSSTATTTQQRKTKWIIHEFHSSLNHPNKDAFVLCKLMKKTRTSRSGTVVDAFSPAAIDLSLTSDPFLEYSQIPTEYKNVVEDDGRECCNDLEELLPEFHTIDWLNHSQFDHFQWESFTDIMQSLERGESSGLPQGENGHVYGPNTTDNSNVRGESSGLPQGENGHVYGPNTTDNSNHLGKCEEVVGHVIFPPNGNNDQI